MSLSSVGCVALIFHRCYDPNEHEFTIRECSSGEVISITSAVVGFSVVKRLHCAVEKHGRLAAGASGGHLHSPGKVEKCYRVKNSISEVSLNGLTGTHAIGLSVS